MANVDYHELLSVLKTMYYRLARLNLAQRLNIHKLKPANDRVDLSDMLNKQIDKLASNRNDNATDVSPQVDAATDGAMGTPVSGRRVKHATTVVDHNELKDYLQNLHHLDDHSVASRLQKSTWHHVHHALLHARRGENDIAKMHAKIAMQAMKEAHPFMGEDEYTRFTESVRMEIDD